MSATEKPKIITVNLDDLAKMVQDGANIVMDIKAEAALMALFDLKGRVDAALDVAKELIEKNALEYNPNFTSVQASRLKVGYQFFGAKYSVNPMHVDKLAKNMYTEKISYAPVPKEIEGFLQEHGSLPLGIDERLRSRTITIKPIGAFEDVE